MPRLYPLNFFSDIDNNLPGKVAIFEKFDDSFVDTLSNLIYIENEKTFFVFTKTFGDVYDEKREGFWTKIPLAYWQKIDW